MSNIAQTEQENKDFKLAVSLALLKLQGAMSKEEEKIFYELPCQMRNDAGTFAREMLKQNHVMPGDEVEPDEDIMLWPDPTNEEVYDNA